MTATDRSLEIWLAVLDDIWVDTLGIDGDELDYGPNESLIDWLDRIGWFEELDFADVLFRLQTELGTQASREDFHQFIWRDAVDGADWTKCVRPKLTNASFAAWIREHTPLPAAEPIEICGQFSPAAGAYLGLAELAKRFASSQPFGPSTPIFDVIRGRNLAQFWKQARLLVGTLPSHGRLTSLPQLTFPYEQLSAACFRMALISLCGAFVAAWMESGILIAAAWSHTVCLFALGARLKFAGDPVPNELSTFADFAKLADGNTKN